MRKLIYSVLFLMMISFISSCDLHQEPFEELKTDGTTTAGQSGGEHEDDGPD